MPTLLGTVTVPSITAGTTPFPIKSDPGYGYATNPRIAVHRFGSGSTQLEQRFLLGNGSVTFTVKRARMSETERKLLENFWITNQGVGGIFPYHAPNPDGTTTTYLCQFRDQKLSFDRVSAWHSSVTVVLVGVPATVPTYAHTSTVVGFSTAVETPLLAQEQIVIPIVKIRPNASYPVICVSDRNLNLTHIAWTTGLLQPPGAVISNAGKSYYSPGGGNSTIAPTHTSGAVTGADFVTWYWIGASPMFWQARLLELPEITQSLGTQSDSASFAFGNADRAFSALINSVDLRRAYLEYSLFHVNSGTLINVWAGRVTDWNLTAQTGESVTLNAADGMYDLTLQYPPRQIDRTCWKRYNGGSGKPCNPPGTLNGAFPLATFASCDHGFNTPNGCSAHNNQVQFGGCEGQPQTVYLKEAGFLGFGGYNLTSISAVADTIMGAPMPEVYCNITTADPSDGFPVTCQIIAGRFEIEYYDLLGVVCGGPIGAFAQQINNKAAGSTPHTADGFPPHGWPNSSDGLRLVLGADPSPSDSPFALGNLSNGITVYGSNPEYAAGTAFVELRIKLPANSTYSALSTHTMQSSVRQGMGCWVWTAPGSAVFITGCTNPVWIMVNAWLRAQNLHYAPLAVMESVFVIGAAIDSASVCDLSVVPLLGTATRETQFTFQGKIDTARPLRDWLTDIAANFNGYFFSEFGRLYIGIRVNSSAVENFNTGNIVLGSLQLPPQMPSFSGISAQFADAQFIFQQNTATLWDQDYSELIGQQGSPQRRMSQINLSGSTSLSQTARLITTLLREELGGAGVNAPAEWSAAVRPSFSTTLLGINATPGMVCSLGGADTMFDLPNYAATDPSNTDSSAAAANFVEFRVLSRKLRKDFGIDISGVSTHKDMYSLDFGPKPQDVLGSAVPMVQDSPPANFVFDAAGDGNGNLYFLDLIVGTYARSVMQANFDVYYVDETSAGMTLVQIGGGPTSTLIRVTGHPPDTGSWIMIGQEIMQVTDVAAFSGYWDITVLRAQLGTTAASYAFSFATISSFNSSWNAELTITSGLPIFQGDSLFAGTGDQQPIAEYFASSGFCRVVLPFTTTLVAGAFVHSYPRVWPLTKITVTVPFQKGLLSSAARSSFQYQYALPYAGIVAISGTVQSDNRLISDPTINDYTANRLRTFGPVGGYSLTHPAAPVGDTIDAFVDAVPGGAESFEYARVLVSGGVVTGTPLETPNTVSAISPQGLAATGTITIAGTISNKAVIAISLTGAQMFLVPVWNAVDNGITGSSTAANVATSLANWLNGDPVFSSMYSSVASGAVINITDFSGSGGTLVSAVSGAITATVTGITSALGIHTGRSYAISFVDTVDTYESSLSVLSASTGPSGSAGEVAISDVPTSGDSRISKVRVYAFPDGFTDGPCYRVAELTNGTTTLTDTITEATLSAQPVYSGPTQPASSGSIVATVSVNDVPWIQMLVPPGSTQSNVIGGLAMGAIPQGATISADVNNGTTAPVDVKILLQSGPTLGSFVAKQITGGATVPDAGYTSPY